MTTYYAYYCWREGPTFVRRHCCDGDTNPLERRYCLVDTIEDIIDFVDAMQSRQKNGQRNTYDAYVRIGHVTRMDTARDAVYVKSHMKELDDGEWEAGNKRRLVMHVLDKAAALADHYTTRADTDRRQWSPPHEPSEFCLAQMLE